MKYLPNINDPADLKKLGVDELDGVASEVRQEIISTVSKIGGHLASNLGAVELIVALHYVYESPRDKFTWDVSHQTYAHKILTGRRDRFHTIKQYKGICGYVMPSESVHDHFGAGHASTSISAALGLATARDAAGEDNHVVAVIGDGAMTGGLAFEGLNNAGSSKRDMLVILNDNTWSISKNVGAMSKYLTNIMTDEKLNKLRNEIWEMTGRFKRRDKIRAAISRIEDSVKSLLIPGMFFEKLGFRYLGPIDGHDIGLLVKTLNDIKNLKGPILLHVGTVKGKGYEPAEDNATKFHGVGKFDKVTGEAPSKTGRLAYTQVFGDTMIELAEKNDKVVAITAAMAPGTGLVEFGERFPDRFFDVGIAEGHAACFAAGLAIEGMRPYLTVYSTFMQRAYDQVIHDIALQNLPVVICMDRAGLVGEDGPTHHGTFDLAYLSSIPNLTLAAPKDGNELRSMLHYTIENDLTGAIAIRYPRDTVPTEMTKDITPIDWGKWELQTEPTEIALLAVGSMVDSALTAQEELSNKGIDVSVTNARFVKPLDLESLDRVAVQAKVIITIEEGQLAGGFGQKVAAHLMSTGFGGKFMAMGIPDHFVTYGHRSILLRELGLDTKGIVRLVDEIVSGKPAKNGRFFSKLRFRRSELSKPEEGAANADLFTGNE